MIIVPDALILSASVTPTPMTHARIGYQTWARGLEPSAVTVSSASANGPKDAPLREDTYEFWEPTELPATWRVDLGAGLPVDYVGLAGRFGSAGVSVQVDTSTNSTDWEALASSVTPETDAPLMFLDDERVARFVRVTFTGGGVMPQLAVFFPGVSLAMQRSIYGGLTPITMARRTEKYQAFSRGGQFLGQGFRRHGVSASASFRFLTAEWVRSDFDPFVRSARQYPFFFAWRPQTFPLEVGYVWVEEDIRPVNMGRNTFMQVGWEMQGVGNE